MRPGSYLELLEIIDVLRPAIQAGTPIVGIEPSCIAVFRDEINNSASE